MRALPANPHPGTLSEGEGGNDNLFFIKILDPKALMSDNPFLSTDFFPSFNRITPEAAVPALQHLLAQATTDADALEATFAPTWEGLAAPLTQLCQPLSLAWTLINHLLSVVNSDAWREAQQTLQPEMVAFSLRIAQSHRFYQGFCAIRDSGDLDTTKTRIVTLAIRAAEKAGVALEGTARDRFNAIQRELAEISTTFSNTVLDAIKAYSLWIRDPAGIDGLPPAICTMAAAAAREAGEADATAAAGPWRITLDAAVASPFLMHGLDRGRREELCRAMAVKATTPPHDNSARVEKILALRREQAGILGYPNFAAVSLESKMAGNVAAVDKLTEQLAQAAREAATRENEELLAFAQENGFTDAKLQPWDRPFWAERLSEARYQYSDEELRAYFQFPLVLEGLFALAQRLFGIHIVADDDAAPVWHPDVRLFRVDDPDSTPRAWFYVDPYSRPATKRSGAWMNDFYTRSRCADGTVRRPLALIVCNQTPPSEGKPSLMRFTEVNTLFHEFGHALQHMLTTVDEPDASGINAVEWDAVEIASQFMENWCYDRATLQSISRHIETGATIPVDLFDRIVAAKNFMAASATLRQLYLGATDMDLHARYPRPGAADADAVKRANAVRFLPAPLLPEDKLLCSFSHIFAGGYAAGYYSYKWSEVLAADEIHSLEQVGLQNKKTIRATGQRFRDTFLSLGGSVHPMEVFKAFRGRAPEIGPLLRHAGLA